MSNVDTFIEEYKKLEEAVRRVYNLRNDQSVIHELKSRKNFEKYKDKIQSVAELRNFYQHNSKIDNEFVVSISDEAIAFVKKLTDIVNSRKRCRDICVSYQDVCWKSLDDSVQETMKLMQETGYANVPILEGGHVVGVFDKAALFAYVAAGDGAVNIDDKLTFRELMPYISCEQRNMSDIIFLGIDQYVDDVVDVFESKMKQGKKLSLVLLTLNGKENEKLLGILTPLDIIVCFD